MLNIKEIKRYNRQIMIEGFGKIGQNKLKDSKVIIVGSGGLGSIISIYLAVAGIGQIGIVDHEDVDLSNLNRQILHWEKDIGRKKVDSAKEKLLGLNPGTKIEAFREKITEKNVSRLVRRFDLIVDALDNFPTRYILNHTAIKNNIPLFHGAVYGFEGRALTIIPGKTACLRCMYRGPFQEKRVPIIGVAPAVIGSIQATEVIKYILGIGDLLTNRLLFYDGLNLKFTEFKVAKNPKCEHCGQRTENDHI